MTAAPKPRLHNIILIRYNMAAPATWHGGAAVNLDHDWLAKRRELFEAYCLHSLKRQTHRDFTALIYFDARTPKPIVAEICREPYCQPILTSPQSGADKGMVQAVRGGVNDVLRALKDSGELQAQDIIATTRLDSDDAISPDYLKLVNAAPDLASQDELYVYFPLGQQYSTQSAEYRSLIHPRNAFGTLFETYAGQTIKTVMHCSHTKLLRRHASRALAQPRPQWCMVIHQGNVENSAMGSPTSNYFPITDRA